MRAVGLWLLLTAAWPAVAADRGSFSEAFTAGSGPYIGNSLSVGYSPGPIDVDLGYDVGSDQDLVLFHSLWGALGIWPTAGLQLSVEGDFGPKVSSNSPARGHYALGSAGGGASITYHPGKRGDIRPYAHANGGYEHLDVEGSTNPSGAGSVSSSFNQSSVSGVVGVDAMDTDLRAGASKFFYNQDAAALRLPPGIGSGPTSLGAAQGALPTRAEDWNVRGSILQRFGAANPWTAELRMTYAPYVDNGGSVTALHARIGKQLTDALRAFIGVTGQLEQLPAQSNNFGLFGSGGVSVRF